MKDRVTVLPESLKQSLREYLERVNMLHNKDLAKGFGRVFLPYALESKYPNASRNGDGSMCFLQRVCPKTHALVKRDDIICMKIAFKRP